MLDHLGDMEAAAALTSAVERYLASSPRVALPHELDGAAPCSKVGDMVVQAIEEAP
jgi:isocitrate/isopropylmalate dehydrogenase